MKNVLNEKPNCELHGRLSFIANFTEDIDIKNKDILDIGCGYGWCELNLEKRGASKVVGIEISEDDLKTAKANITSDKIDFRVASATNLPFESESFDTVVCWEVIEHIPKGAEITMFTEVNRVLKNNGSFYMSTPFNSFFSKVLDPAWWLIGHRHYSKDFFENLAKETNFRIEKIELGGEWFELIGMLDFYFCKWILRRGMFFKDWFERKTDEEFLNNKGWANIFIKFRKEPNSKVRKLEAC